MPPDPSSRHGILDPHAGEGRFTLTRHDPAPALAAVVERHWIVRWDLRDRPPFEQETLPFPCVNLVFGSHRPGVHGVCTDRFVARLEGQGWVVGTKFRPGGFRRFVDVAIAELTDRVIAIDAAFGGDGAAVDRAVHAAPDDAARLRLVTELLVARGRRDADDATALAVRAVELARTDPAIGRVADLAAQVGVPVRGLERIFRSHVGVPPKWVIRRFRVQEAAARVADGAPADWAALAHDLGYFDQAHFIRDFRAQIGRTPAEYAARCAAARRGP